jgi:hypothetical protein
VVPSLKVHVALSRTVIPLGIEGLAGVTAIEVKVAAVTGTVVEPEIPPCVAVMVALPTPVPVTRPVGETCPTVRGAEVQLTDCVRSCVVPSVKVPVTVSCTVVPLAIEGLMGAIAMETSVACVTVTVVEPAIPLRVAVTGVFPALRPVTTPCVPEALLTTAIVLSPEVQLT